MGGTAIDSSCVRPARRAGLAAAFLLMAAIAPLPGWAAGADGLPPPTLPAARVVAGRTVVIRWPEPPAGVEELEVLLAIDGERYGLRASRELEGREIEVVWRVPNLATGTARLRLRARIHGVEVEGPPGPSFEIVADADRPPELDLVHEDGWWPGIERTAAPPAASMESRTSLRLGSRLIVNALTPPPQLEGPESGPAHGEPLLSSNTLAVRPLTRSLPSRLEVPRRE